MELIFPEQFKYPFKEGRYLLLGFNLRVLQLPSLFSDACQDITVNLAMVINEAHSRS